LTICGYTEPSGEIGRSDESRPIGDKAAICIAAAIDPVEGEVEWRRSRCHDHVDESYIALVRVRAAKDHRAAKALVHCRDDKHTVQIPEADGSKNFGEQAAQRRGIEAGREYAGRGWQKAPLWKDRLAFFRHQVKDVTGRRVGGQAGGEDRTDRGATDGIEAATQLTARPEHFAALL
jgi:hypothetical protein